MRFSHYPNNEITFYPTNIHISNSFLIVDDEDKKHLIDCILTIKPNYPRTKKSMLREWKVHNALYQRGIKVESTKDTDLEAHQKLIYKIGYFLASIFIRERKNK